MSCSFCPEELRGGLTRWQIENPAPDRKRTKNWRTCDQCHTDADNPNCQPSVDPS
nr:hypothetical protein I302_00961 [Kwoniella bestiolae CBS 10118]OCF29456.1 hypothetical protein I302_00961 [Kwoniella bestiolae CBS 10118]